MLKRAIIAAALLASSCGLFRGVEVTAEDRNGNTATIEITKTENDCLELGGEVGTANGSIGVSCVLEVPE